MLLEGYFDVYYSQEDVMKDSATKPKVKQSGIMNIHGKDIPTYPAIIDYAHQGGIKSLEVDLLQFPTKDNGMMAICSATVVKTSGEVFREIGDASPDNVPRGCSDSFIRMAATRAKSRVISDAYNIRNAMEEGRDDRPQPVSGAVVDVEYWVEPEPTRQDNKALTGGGDKPITAKQAGLIHSRASKHGVDPEQRSREMYGKPMESLVGWEADQVIKSFKH